MSNVKRGKLILKEVPAGEVEKKVVMLLLKFAKNATVEALTQKVRNTPFALSNDIAAEKAILLLEALQKFGATAVFIPHVTEKPANEPITPFKSEPRFTFNPQPDFEEEPPPVKPAAKKNGSRRLTVILVTILLLLSLGYLAWQLWPLIGD
ncbi:MAG: hypothetical protein ACWGNO_18875, partial [Desulfobacterales bacterium]